MSSPKSKKKIIGLDFDGVLHSYVSGYSEYPQDPPVPGAQDFCKNLLRRDFDLVVFTARISEENYTPERHDAIIQWLQNYQFPYMRVTGQKPIADLYIDDNGYRFKGDFTDALSGIDSGELLATWYPKSPIQMRDTCLNGPTSTEMGTSTVA